MNRPTEGTRPNRRGATTKPQASSVITAPTWLRMIAPSPMPIAPHSATLASPPSTSSAMSPLLERDRDAAPADDRVAERPADRFADDSEGEAGERAGDDLCREDAASDAA